jgi:nicotinamide riboside transporter PnuC
MEYIGWIATLIAMIGVVLNARHNIICFYLWIGSNSYYTVVNVLAGSYSQAALFAFNLVMAVYGIYCWKRKETK